MAHELTIRENKLTKDGGVFPFVISKKNYMIVGGFDTFYPSPYVCDWDFFLKLDLNEVEFYKTHNLHFYHFKLLFQFIIIRYYSNNIGARN